MAPSPIDAERAVGNAVRNFVSVQERLVDYRQVGIQSSLRLTSLSTVDSQRLGIAWRRSVDVCGSRDKDLAMSNRCQRGRASTSIESKWDRQRCTPTHRDHIHWLAHVARRWRVFASRRTSPLILRCQHCEQRDTWPRVGRHGGCQSGRQVIDVTPCGIGTWKKWQFSDGLGEAGTLLDTVAFSGPIFRSLEKGVGTG